MRAFYYWDRIMDGFVVLMIIFFLVVLLKLVLSVVTSFMIGLFFGAISCLLFILVCFWIGDRMRDF